MLGATFTHWDNGWVFTATDGSWEYPLFLIAASLVRALLGKGAYPLRLRYPRFGYATESVCRTAAVNGKRRLQHFTTGTKDIYQAPDAPRGSRNVASRPPVAMFFSFTEPPWACAMLRAIERPRPLPPLLRFREPSTR